MSSEPISPQTTPATGMIRTLGLISTLCGLIIVAAYQGSFNAVQDNKRIALERAVFKVIPEATSIVEFLAPPNGLVVRAASAESPQQPGWVKFYAGYDNAGALRGIAAEGVAKGYADNVRVLFSYDPARHEIPRFSVVSMRETPGIGDKILKDKTFIANFPLDAKLSADLKTLANAIRTVKNGSKTSPWEIDAISGATITSRAVGRAVNDAAQTLLPRIGESLDSIKEKP